MSEVNQVDYQVMQHLLTDGVVDWDGYGNQLALKTDSLVGGKNTVLIFDESGFAKKGKSSAGGDRQWNGRLGKVDNFQVGVFTTLSREDGWRVSSIYVLYLPEGWIIDPERGDKAVIPKDDQHFKN